MEERKLPKKQQNRICQLIRRANSLEKTLMLVKTEGRRKTGQQRMHHQLNRCEFEQTPGDGEGQGSLLCCSTWGCKVLGTNERLHNHSNLLQ